MLPTSRKPRRGKVCSKAQSFSTASAEGTSGIAFTSDRDGDDEIFVMDADGANQTNLSNNAIFDDNQPSWSPDGQRIAFVSNRDGNREIYAIDADGGNPTRVTNNPDADHDPAWSPAGDRDRLRPRPKRAQSQKDPRST